MKAYNILWDIDEGDDVILPTEIEIPEEIASVEDKDEREELISDYISDLTGFCHYGFELEGEGDASDETEENLVPDSN